jgi:hypothetical protein
VTIPTAAASPWPVRCAYTAAALFIAASGATNVTYGWSKGDTLATSLVWAGVALHRGRHGLATHVPQQKALTD